MSCAVSIACGEASCSWKGASTDLSILLVHIHVMEAATDQWNASKQQQSVHESDAAGDS